MFVYFVFLIIIITEILLGIILWPFNRLLDIPYHETPQIHYLHTETNRKIINGLPISKFECPAWLTGTFIQSFIWYFTSSKGPKFRREFVELPDGVEIAIDIKEHPDTPPDAPLVMMCHGLAGSSKDPSINMYANELVNKLKWRCIVYIRRGHDGTSIAPKSMKETGNIPDNLPANFKLFPKHCDLDDMKFICEHIFKKYPNAPKFLAGLSVGSNLVVKYLAEYKHEFLAGISFCNGIHITELTNHFDEEQADLANMMAKRHINILRNNLSHIKKLTNYLEIKADFKRMLCSKNIRSFDENILPLIGYKKGELDKYYLENSCLYSFDKISVPLLCMTAMDDPIISRSIPKYSVEAAKNNKNIITIITERGGHLGWMIGLRTSWSTNIFTSFFKMILCSKKT